MAIGSMQSASSQKLDFMNLLVTQLQNQNPLEPMDNNEMASQLAQFSQLQQLESMNSNFANVLSATDRNYANSLIGKEISFASENETGGRDITSGIVEEVINNVDGEIVLVTANHAVPLEGILSVKN